MAADFAERLYQRRRIKNGIALSLAIAATAFGLFWLVWILWTALLNGISSINWALFSQMTVATPNVDYPVLAAIKNLPAGIQSATRYLETFPDTPANKEWGQAYLKKWNERPRRSSSRRSMGSSRPRMSWSSLTMQA